jgi:hypothetical protein
VVDHDHSDVRAAESRYYHLAARSTPEHKLSPDESRMLRLIEDRLGALVSVRPEEREGD